MKDNFYVVLPSNVLDDTEDLDGVKKKNTPSLWTTTFDRTEELKGQWEVAVSEVSYVNSITTFTKDDTISFANALSFSDVEANSKASTAKKFQITKFVIPDASSLKFDEKTGYNPNDIVQMINNVINQKVFTLSYYPPNRKSKSRAAFKLKVHLPGILIWISPKLRRLLDFNDQHLTHGGEYWSHGSLDVTLKEKQSPNDLYMLIFPLYRMKKRKIILKPNDFELNGGMIYSYIQHILRDQPDLAKYFRITEKSNPLTKKYIFHKLPTAADDDDFAVIELNDEFRQALRLTEKQTYFVMPGRYPSQDNSIPYSSRGEWAITIYSKEYIESEVAYITGKDNQIITPPREYHTREGIAQMLVELNKYSQTHKYKFTFLKDRNRMQLKAGEKVVILSETMRDILGFDRRQYFQETIVASKRPAYNRSIHHLYLYSNLGDFVHVGNAYVQLLRTFARENQINGDNVEKPFIHPMYIPVIKNNLDNIEIKICDDNGKVIPFADDCKTIVTLHFRRVNA